MPTFKFGAGTATLEPKRLQIVACWAVAFDITEV
jgi:hypothetical protein